MTYKSHVNLEDYPEGFITDYLPAGHYYNENQDLTLYMVNLPVTATITFSIELLNLTASLDHSFVIKTKESEIMKVDQTIVNLNKTFSVETDHQPYYELIYWGKMAAMDGEYIRIKYKGKYNGHLLLLFL